MKKAILIAAVVSAVAAAQAVILDDFTVSQADIQLTSAGSVDTRFAAGSFFGFDTRWTFARLDASPFNQPLDVKLQGNGLGIVNSGVGTDAYIQLNYFTSGSNTVNLSGIDTMKISFADNTRDLTVFWAAWSDNYSNLAIGSQSIVAADFTGEHELDLTSTTSNSGVNMAALDEFAFIFDPKAGGDFSITQIDAVPEPGTIGALLVGLGALARRRRR